MEQVSRYSDRQVERRRARRDCIVLPGRIVWRDARGTARFATVRTRDLNSEWTFVECLSGAPIPLYRLVHLHIDHVPAGVTLPDSFRRGRILSAVYRVGPSLPTTGAPEGYALRLLVAQERRPAMPADPNERETPDVEAGEMIA